MKNLKKDFKIKLSNTLTQMQEEFVLNDKILNMYVCGITPYDYAHIGHGRVYITFDVLFRFFQFLGYEVNYCRNFTDVDDKLIERARKEYNDPHKFSDVATKFINSYHKDMHLLNCIPPTFEPRVTENIKEIILFIEGLIKYGKAYQTNGDVYFDISQFPEYGKLSKRNLENLLAGARIQIREEKRNPKDFALWKSEPTDEPGWQSPWGWGRPGWHIDCSALAKKYLAETIDIHAGGMDLIFPHHENEVAQSEALHNKIFARYWLHNAFVRINQEKMSKSLGNFITLNELFKKYHPPVIRYYYLNHHYRRPLDFSYDDVDAFAKSYQKLALFFNEIEASEFDETQYPIFSELLNALCDDLNTPKLFGILFDNLKNLQNDKKQAGIIKNLLINILGITLEPVPVKETVITPEIQELINKRQEARASKNWAQADAIRDELKQLGFDVQDGKTTPF